MGPIPLACLLTVLTVLSGRSTWARSYCSSTNIHRCLDPFNAKYMKNETSEDFFGYYDEAGFTELCRDYATYENCLNDFKDTCDGTQRAIFEGEEDAFGYACGEGFDVYVRNSKCFLIPEVIRDGRECGRTFEDISAKVLSEMDNVRYQEHLDDLREEFCDAVDVLLSCVTGVIGGHCNDELAEWQSTFDTKSLGPRLDVLGCGSAGGGLSTIAIVSIVVSCVAVIFIITAGVCWFLRARKRKLQSQTSAQYVYGNNMNNMAMQPQAGGALPMAAPPAPPSYVEKAPPYEPQVSVAPSSAPPSYQTMAPPPVDNLHLHMQTPNGGDKITGIDNPTYTT